MGKGGNRKNGALRKGQERRLRQAKAKAKRTGGKVEWFNGRPHVVTAQRMYDETQRPEEPDYVAVDPISISDILGPPEGGTQTDGNDISD